MLKFCKKHEGVISVFLTLILIPTFIFGGVVIDGSRILGAKNMISGAGDLAMNAALSNYNVELNKTYGLLAMASTAEEVNSTLQNFFETTLNANGISDEDFSKALVYLELTEDGFLASDVVDTEIYQTEVIKQQILEYMKYRAPVTLTNRLITDKLADLENAEKERRAADAEIKFESDLDDMQTLFDEMKKLTDKQQEIYDTMKTEGELNGLLKTSFENYQEITMLSTAYFRMMHCSDTKDGDTEGLMKEMIDLSCEINHITAENASNIIQMLIIQNSMQGKNPDSILEGLDENSDEYKEKKELVDDYKDAVSVCTEGVENTQKQLDKLVEDTYLLMSTQKVLAVSGEQNCQDILEQLEKIREKFEKLREKYEEWKSAVADLPDGESKTAYQDNIDRCSGFFEAEGVIGEFESKIQNNEVFYREVKEKLDQVTFTGYSVDSINSKSIFIGEADYGGITTASEIISCGENFMVRYHDIGSMGLSVSNKSIQGDEFVKLLKEFYCKEDGSDKSAADGKADEWNQNLSDTITKLEHFLLSDDLNDLNVGTLGQNDLPSNWLAASSEDESDSNDDGVDISGGLKDKGQRKKVSDHGSDNLNKDSSNILEMSSLGAKIAQKGEVVVEPLMLTEYVMGMFSHYVSNKDAEGNDIDNPLSINRSEIKEHELYRAEIEYILWGNDDIRSNVGATKAILFTVNLIFNMGFVFTNSTIKNDALTIANLFPVGALARTAIKCALQAMVAMIETTRNMLDLMDGKSVPLLKDKTKWDTWIIHEGGTRDQNASGFTYEDYLWVLVCIKMYFPSGQTALLSRTADCIELNITEIKSNMDNSLKDMHTMISLDATVYIDTFFLQKLNGIGYSNREVDKESFKVSYHGIQGY